MERPTPEEFGFSGSETNGWIRQLRGRTARFRLLRTLADLSNAEQLQEDVFGVTERDLIPANELIVVEETGGMVIGAFLPETPERAVGVLVGWGGFVGRPRLVSDFLAVRSEARNLGLAAEMKRLQTALALARGFEEIVWTVDPLRAANARLNFGKLGAIARHYEFDRYGSSFAASLYGGMPTDRLHVTWEITTPRVLVILRGKGQSAGREITVPPALFVPGATENRIAVTMPADIDALLANDPAEALARRMAMRAALTAAFAEGFTITGYLPPAGDDPHLILERDQRD